MNCKRREECAFIKITQSSSKNLKKYTSTPIMLLHHHFVDKLRRRNGTYSAYGIQEALSQSYGVKLSEECVGQTLLPQTQSVAESAPWSSWLISPHIHLTLFNQEVYSATQVECCYWKKFRMRTVLCLEHTTDRKFSFYALIIANHEIESVNILTIGSAGTVTGRIKT